MSGFSFSSMAGEFEMNRALGIRLCAKGYEQKGKRCVRTTPKVRRHGWIQVDLDPSERGSEGGGGRMKKITCASSQRWDKKPNACVALQKPPVSPAPPQPRIIKYRPIPIYRRGILPKEESFAPTPANWKAEAEQWKADYLKQKAVNKALLEDMKRDAENCISLKPGERKRTITITKDGRRSSTIEYVKGGISFGEAYQPIRKVAGAGAMQ